MAKLNIGSKKTVDISLNKPLKLINSLVKFLEKQGIEEIHRRKTPFGMTMVELNANDMYPTWDQLRGALKDKFPDLKLQYSEDDGNDEDDYYVQEVENLTIYD